jgi:hypothetical protein
MRQIKQEVNERLTGSSGITTVPSAMVVTLQPLQPLVAAAGTRVVGDERCLDVATDSKMGPILNCQLKLPAAWMLVNSPSIKRLRHTLGDSSSKKLLGQQEGDTAHECVCTVAWVGGWWEGE